MAPSALLCLLLAGAAGAAPPDEAWLERASADLAAEAASLRGERAWAPAVQEFLLRRYAQTRDPGALAQASRSLAELAVSGARDHIGGGFLGSGREKTLRDNAELASVYLDAYQAGKDPNTARVARETLDYILRDLARKDGGFYASERGGQPYYLWSRKEIERVLGASVAEMFCYRYGVTSEGGMPYEAKTAAETAAKFGRSEGEVGRTLGVAREKLRLARAKRPRPSRDAEVVAASNGLMVSALARGYQVLEEKSYLEAAERTARFLHKGLYDPKARRLRHAWRKGAEGGSAADYAFLAQGLLDLYEASFDPDWLDWALESSQSLEETTPDGGGAEADSVRTRNLLRLSQFFGRPDLRAAAERVLSKVPDVAGSPPEKARRLSVLGTALSRPRQIVISGVLDDPGTREMLRAVHARYLPDKILMVVPPGPVQKKLAVRIAALKGMTPIGGKPTAYICVDFACELPSNDLRAVEGMLDGKGVGEALRKRLP